MKTKYVFQFIITAVLLVNFCKAQYNNYSVIPSKPLAITCNKTTNLIFPYPIESIDRGSRDILVQQPKGTQNVVQLKAGKPDFSQTNLSIITTDGQLYSFIVDYQAAPAALNMIIQTTKLSTVDSTTEHVIKTDRLDDPALSDLIAQKILGLKIKHIAQDHNAQITFILGGIYINHDMVYFRFKLHNNSALTYDVDNIQFVIKDFQKAKRTAVQENQITPAFNYGSFQQVSPGSVVDGIIAVPKFTLPGSKYLSIQINEKDGDRNLNIALKNRQLIRAKSIGLPN